MNHAFLLFLLKSEYRVNELNFENKIEIKPRSHYKQNAINNLLAFVVSIVCFILLSKVPYAGPVFFLIGLMGSLYSITFFIKALLIYKHYDQIFSEENISKLINK